jgi:uncharacterized protein YjiS (DUF1127 family)
MADLLTDMLRCSKALPFMEGPMATHVLNSAADLVSADRPVSLRARFLAWREKRRQRARMARELMSYTDRELLDLGITRSDIPAIINGTFRR